MRRLQDLELPPKDRALVRRIAKAIKGGKMAGVTALFVGESGPAKMLAAEALARETGLPLHRIDVAAVVSKFIGETEMQLHQVVIAAEGRGAILLFDEADALFGKRSEVKDSHDRYANIDVDYLLQRLEAFRGLVIFAVCKKPAVDPALLRRLHFVVDFSSQAAPLRRTTASI